MRHVTMAISVVVVAGCGFTVSGSPPGASDAVISDTLDGAIPSGHCAPLAAAPSPTPVSTVTDLRVAITSASAGDTITLAAGTYDLQALGVKIATPLTLRSASGGAADVILTGTALPLIEIRASDVTIASLTFAQAGTAIRVQPLAGTLTGTRIYDVTFADVTGPAIRISSGTPADHSLGPYADNGTIACSRFAGAPSAAHCSPGTLAIDGSAIRGWVIRDNHFEGLACDSQNRRMVWIGHGSRDTQITNNVFKNLAMNIMIGGQTSNRREYSDALPSSCGSGPPDHWGGLVCNNALAGLGATSPGIDFEEGVALWDACDTWVMHNTIVSPVETYSDVEYRFQGTYVHLVNNLLARAPRVREAAGADPAFASSNAIYASASDFVDAIGANLHLSSVAAPPPGASIAGLPGCDHDADDKLRPTNTPTVGAYER